MIPPGYVLGGLADVAPLDAVDGLLVALAVMYFALAIAAFGAGLYAGAGAAAVVGLIEIVWVLIGIGK